MKVESRDGYGFITLLWLGFMVQDKGFTIRF